MSARQRALHSLQKIKDVSKEIFRNLQNVSKAGRDEPGAAEKEETLRSQRDKYVQLLCTFQSQLSDTTRELETAMECKRKMGDMKKKIDAHEAAVRNFGRDLQSAEEVLSGVLRRASAWLRGDAPHARPSLQCAPYGARSRRTLASLP